KCKSSPNQPQSPASVKEKISAPRTTFPDTEGVEEISRGLPESARATPGAGSTQSVHFAPSAASGASISGCDTIPPPHSNSPMHIVTSQTRTRSDISQLMKLLHTLLFAFAIITSAIAAEPHSLKSSLQPALKNGGFKWDGHILWCSSVIK